MTNKNIFLILILLMNASCLFSQVGVGITSPNASAQLDVTATDKGILLTKVNLTGIDDTTTITNGNIEGLILYNQATAGIGVNAVSPGFYYWSGTEWSRLATRTPVSKRLGEFVYAKSGKTLADGYLAVSAGAIPDGATLYPLWAAQYPEFVSGVDIVFPADVDGMFLRNTGGNANIEGDFQGYTTALPNTPFTTDDDTHSHTYTDLTNTGNVGRQGGGQSTANGNESTANRTTSTNTHNHTITGGGDIETIPVNLGYQLYTLVDTF